MTISTRRCVVNLILYKQRPLVYQCVKDTEHIYMYLYICSQMHLDVLKIDELKAWSALRFSKQLNSKTNMAWCK